MKPLPEIRSWRSEINPEEVEPRVRWLKEQIQHADLAIEAQQRIIATDGPLDAYLMSMNSLRQSQQRMEQALAELMRLRESEVIDFALDGKRYSNHRADAKSLAIFLDSIQRLFERVGQALSTSRLTPAIPFDIRRQCQLQIAGFYPSSFGIKFTAPTLTDLTGTSLASTALDATFELVNSENPIDQAERLGQRVMNNYRHLINTMVKVEATPKVGWRTADGYDRSWTADENTLLVLANRLSRIHETEPKVLQACGTLTGASLRRHKFEFNGDNGLITGKAPSDVEGHLTSHFGKRCKITYTEVVIIDENTDQERRSRVLLDVTPL